MELQTRQYRKRKMTTTMMMRFPKCNDKDVSKSLSVRRVCSYCKKVSNEKLMKCGSCDSVSYCDAKCQQQDWKKFHKHVCNDVCKPSITKRVQKFNSDVKAHLIWGKINDVESVLDTDGMVWAVINEDDKFYYLKQLTTKDLVNHLKKINISTEGIKLHITRILKGSSFIIFLEGQVICMSN
tara:strand:- start:54 stop:599 length:546 start_codon:yes stop_codon:yes gene_type:complete